MSSWSKPGKALLWGTDGCISLCPHSGGLHTHDLITSQRPHLLAPWLWGWEIQHTNWRGKTQTLNWLHIVIFQRLQEVYMKYWVQNINIRHSMESIVMLKEGKFNLSIKKLSNSWPSKEAGRIIRGEGPVKPHRAATVGSMSRDSVTDERHQDDKSS